MLWATTVGSQAKAESSPIVDCRIGSFAQAMPDFVCHALERGAEKLRAPNHPGPVGDSAGQLACAAEMDRYLRAPYPGAFIQPCSVVWESLTTDYAARLAARAIDQTDRERSLRNH